MAKKKLIFDPNEDAETGYKKWGLEYMRTKYDNSSAEEEDAAYRNMRYFREKLAEKKNPLEKPEPKPGGIDQRKYKKPWPGWSNVLKKL